MLHSCHLLHPEVSRETFLLVPLGILSGDLFLMNSHALGLGWAHRG